MTRTRPPSSGIASRVAIDGELASRSDDDTATTSSSRAALGVLRRGVRWMSLGAAAAALAAAVLAVQVISLHHRLDDARVTGAKDAAASFARAGRVVGAADGRVGAVERRLKSRGRAVAGRKRIPEERRPRATRCRPHIPVVTEATPDGEQREISPKKSWADPGDSRSCQHCAG